MDKAHIDEAIEFLKEMIPSLKGKESHPDPKTYADELVKKMDLILDEVHKPVSNAEMQIINEFTTLLNLNSRLIEVLNKESELLENRMKRPNYNISDWDKASHSFFQEVIPLLSQFRFLVQCSPWGSLVRNYNAI